jgi:hypothetical protein
MAIAVSKRTLKACRVGPVSVPPPVPVIAASQPIAAATASLTPPRGAALAITTRSLKKPS